MDFNSKASLAAHQGAARGAFLAACALLVAGCAVGPDYKRPSVSVPPAFKEDADWKAAAPEDDANRGAWWEAFNDPVLNQLEVQIETSNQSVREAVANYEESRQIARADRTGYLPDVSISGSAERSRAAAFTSVTQSTTGATQSTTTGTTTTTVATAPNRGLTSNLFTAELQASWEPDIWGKLSRTVESDVETAQASAADLALARLSMQGTLAQDYIQLRSADDQIRLLEDAVEAYKRTLKITNNKYAVGVAARSDIITAQTQLDSTRAQLIAEGVTRAQLEHAIAVLVGKAPSDFSVARTPTMGLTLPQIPPQLPAALLERRPDVAAAERQAAAANAKIGVQTAAYFPTLSLSADGGYDGPQLQNLITAPFKFWTIGAQAADSLLDWGQRHDLVLSARATYEASAANYRQTVLTALQQVEDGLSELRILKQESTVQDAAVSEAAQASQIALNEYNAGTVDFTTVAAAQVTELTNRETALGIVENRLTSSVALIQALGGGWRTADLPSPGQVTK
jgi:NodT family efflux transporter outer membrane factor (OMF) lipoprotein